VRNTVEKTSKVTQEKVMIGRVNNQVPTLSPAHDFKHAQCELEGKLEMILVKEWSCNLFEIFSLRQSMPLLANCSKRGTHGTTPNGRRSHTNFKCA